MVARQLEGNSQILLEDPLTFPAALGSGVVLALVALFVYLTSPFEYRQDLAVPFGILFFAGDIFFVLSTRKIKILIDKNEKTMTVDKFSLVGRKRFIFPFDKIKKMSFRRDGQLYLLSIPIVRFYMEDGNVFSYDYMIDEVFDASVVASFMDLPLDTGEARDTARELGMRR
jgi:hypothetical protein